MPPLAALQHTDRYHVIHLFERDRHTSPFTVPESFPLKDPIRAFFTLRLDPTGLDETLFLVLLLERPILHGFQCCFPRRIERTNKKLAFAPAEGCTTARNKRD